MSSIEYQLIKDDQPTDQMIFRVEQSSVIVYNMVDMRLRNFWLS